MEQQAIPTEETQESQPVETPPESAETEVQETPEETPAVEEVEPTPQPKKQTAQERIDEITKKYRTAERDVEYWREKALQSQPAQQPVEKPAVTPPQDLPPRPTIDQFETNEQYEDALFDWRDKVNEIKSSRARLQSEYKTALDSFNTKALAMRKQHPDFDTVVEAPVFTDSMRVAILNSENGPQLAYHLGLPENRETADRIRAMPPQRQMIEIGRLEANLELAAKTKKTTTAPEPIEPVGMSGGGAQQDPSKMTTEQWMEWDKQRRLERIKKSLE